MGKCYLCSTLYFHIWQLYILTNCGFDTVFWVILNITFFFSLQRVNGHIGLCKAKTGDSKNSSVEIFSWMRPMGFSLMTSLPSSVRWVLLPCCESSNSQTWWVSVDVIVLYQGWWVRKIPRWSGAAQMWFMWLTEKLCRDFKVVGHLSFPLVTVLKNKGCALSWYVWFFSCLGQNSGFFPVDFFRKHLEGLLTLSWGEWPATRYVNIFVPWAFWLLLEYEVHVCLIEHFPFLLFELDDSYQLLSVSSLSCW